MNCAPTENVQPSALSTQHSALSTAVAEQVELIAKYAGYIERERYEVERARSMEERRLPADFDYLAMTGLRREAQQKLQQMRPVTLGQAARLAGVNPADIAVLIVHLQRAQG